MPDIPLAIVEPTKPWPEMIDDELDELAGAMTEAMMTTTRPIDPPAGASDDGLIVSRSLATDPSRATVARPNAEISS